MSFIVSTNQAQPVPLAGSDGESTAVPQTFVIPDDGKSIPIATSHCEAVTVTIEAALKSPAETGETANIYARASRDSEWYLLTSIDTSTGDPASERLACPIGHLQVENIGAESIKVFIQGIQQH